MHATFRMQYYQEVSIMTLQQLSRYRVPGEDTGLGSLNYRTLLQLTLVFGF